MTIALALFLGSIAGIFLLALVIMVYFKQKLGPNYNQLKNEIMNIGTNKKMYYSKEKSLGGMTKIVEPVIIQDFKSFSKELLYNKAKRDIVSILNILTSKSIKEIENNKELVLVRKYLMDKIYNMKKNEIEEKFINPTVTRTVIREYRKYKGAATIVLSSAVDYYYETNQKSVECYDDVKKSARIDTEYVYVYDEDQFDSETHFSLNCPTCGAAIKNIGGNCVYCGAHIEQINLKAWKINSFDIKH